MIVYSFREEEIEPSESALSQMYLNGLAKADSILNTIASSVRLSSRRSLK